MSVLSDRYASPEMVSIWSRREKVILERRLWISVMRAQRSLGVSIPESAIQDYLRVQDQVDLASIDARELINHHDVKARIEEFNALAGHQYIHLGMTSRDLTENVEAIQIKEALTLLKAKVAALLDLLAERSESYAELAMVARTHNVPAQVTTLGKRFANWAEELLFAFEHLVELAARFPIRGIKGATGTNVDMIELMGERFVELDESIRSEWGFADSMISASQIYPRSFDLEVIATLVQLSGAPANIATNVRLMSGFGLVAEGFADRQVGSSAMPHKVNPRVSERINALSAILKGYLMMASEISGDQWNEGDVSCSAVRRVTLPDSFFALDAIIESTISVVAGLNISESKIAAELSEYLPELCSSLILNLAVKSGVAREVAYEAIKQHAKSARESAGSIDFIELIAADATLSITRESIAGIMSNPLSMAGAAPTQARQLAAKIRGAISGIEVDVRHGPGVIR